MDIFNLTLPSGTYDGDNLLSNIYTLSSAFAFGDTIPIVQEEAIATLTIQGTELSTDLDSRMASSRELQRLMQTIIRNRGQRSVLP